MYAFDFDRLEVKKKYMKLIIYLRNKIKRINNQKRGKFAIDKLINMFE